MILFYSDYCKHCNILLETIKRHDKNNVVKLVSIDTLRSQKRPIDPKIHSVPALMLTTTKEYMFGKAVFDYLLLPNRGVLFTNQLSKATSGGTSNGNASAVNTPVENQGIIGEPSAFSLGSIYSESFSSLENDEQLCDKNYNWDIIDGGSGSARVSAETQLEQPIDTVNNDNCSQKKNLPTMEDIMKQRANDLV